MAWAAAIAGVASQNEQSGGGISGMAGSLTSYFYSEAVTRPYQRKIAKEGAKDIREQGREIGAKQVAGYAKAGVRTDVGTPLAVAKDTASKAELSALRFIFGHEREMWETKMNQLLDIQMKFFPGLEPLSKGMRFRTGQQPSVSSDPFSASAIMQQKYPAGTVNLYGEHGSAINLNPQMATARYGGLA